MTTNLIHDCGGRVERWRDLGTDEFFLSCPRCEAFTYGDSLPTGTDRGENMAARDRGEMSSPMATEAVAC